VIVAESGNDKYITQLSNGTVTISADTTGDNGGSGKCFRPHDLLCAALASCLNITVRMVVDKRNLTYDRVITEVDVDRSNPDKTTFLYRVEIIGDIDEETKTQLIAEALNCPVRKTLSKDIAFQSMSE